MEPHACFTEEMGSADAPEESGCESIPIWPDTDDEEQMSMNFVAYRKNTEQSTLSTLEGFFDVTNRPGKISHVSRF